MEFLMSEEQRRGFQARRLARDHEQKKLRESIRSVRDKEISIKQQHKIMDDQAREARQQRDNLNHEIRTGAVRYRCKENVELMKLWEPVLQSLCALFCDTLPRELRDMVYHEIILQNLNGDSRIQSIEDLSQKLDALKHLRTRGIQKNLTTQIILEFSQALYRSVQFFFEYRTSEYMSRFLRRNPIMPGLLSAGFVRSLEFGSGFPYCHLNKNPEEPSTPIINNVHKPRSDLCVILPRLLRVVNERCAVTLRFRSMRRTHMTDCDLQFTKHMVFLSNLILQLLRRGSLGVLKLGEEVCSTDPGAETPCDVFGQPFGEWVEEQDHLWADLYRERKEQAGTG